MMNTQNKQLTGTAAEQILPGRTYYDREQKRVIYVPQWSGKRADNCHLVVKHQSVRMFPRILDSVIKRLNKLKRHINLFLEALIF